MKDEWPHSSRLGGAVVVIDDLRHPTDALEVPEGAPPTRDALLARVLPIDALLSGLPVIEVDEELATRISHGNVVTPPEGVPSDPVCRIMRDGRLLAVGGVRRGRLKPARVLNRA